VTTTNLQMPDKETCAFCAYLLGQRPYTVLSRDDSVAILVTREQRGIPHVLVLPVRHTETVLDLADEDACALMLGVRSAARAIDKAYKRHGISVWQNNGVPANQSIQHVHFHVAGTLDTGGTAWGDVHELTVAETEVIAERLRPWLK